MQAKTAKLANDATKHANKVGTKKAHLEAAELHRIYSNQLLVRMEARGQSYSRTLGYHSDMETYHKQVVKGKKAIMPRKYNPRNDPASMRYRYQIPYYD